MVFINSFQAAQIPIDAIDLSYANGSVRWPAVEADAVIIRMGYRGYGSGALKTDAQWAKNIAGAERAGKPYGCYWFSQAVSEDEAEEEAAYCIALLEGHSPQFPVYLDSEYANGGQGRGDSLRRADRTAYAAAWCRAIEAAGFRAGVYASEDWWKNHLNAAALTDYSIWCAKVSQTAPDIGADYDGWQYTFSGSDPGVTGDVDRSYFYTDFAEEDDTVTQAEFNAMADAWWAEFRAELQAKAGSSWSEADRTWAESSGLFQGGEDGFMWQDFLTREQAAALFHRQAGE